MVIVSLFISISVFACLKSVPILMEMLDLYGCMTIFGIGCTVGAIFVLYALEETSGVPLDEVLLISDENGHIAPNNLDQRSLTSTQHQRIGYQTFDNNN